jgi:hypothetical protein
MPVPWLRILDLMIGVTDLARSRKIRQTAAESGERAEQQSLEAAGPGGGLAGGAGGIEARLAGVVVAALKEAFERDTRRLEFEKAQIDAEHERAERALRLELRRQSGDREIGRLRMLAAIAVAAWIGTLFFSARLIGGPVGARVMVGGGWLLLLLAFALAFNAQAQIAEALNRDDGSPIAGVTGTLSLWFIVAGLALVGLAVLVG